MNIAFYLKLKSAHLPVKSHPVIARIAAARDTIQKLKSVELQLFSHLETTLEVLKEKRKLGDNLRGVDQVVKQKKVSKNTAKKV